MYGFGQFVREFLRREDGPTTVEYAVMLALIIAVCVAAVDAFGNTVKGSLEQSNKTCFAEQP